MIFKCKTHNVTLEMTEKERRFTNPPGFGYGLFFKCQLHQTAQPKAGVTDGCDIEEVGQPIPDEGGGKK